MRLHEISLHAGIIDFNPAVDLTLFDLDVAAERGTLTDKQKKEFGQFLRDHKNDFIRLYHGTVSTHDVIGKGLLPTTRGRAKSLQSAAGYVYLAYDPRQAVNFARMAYAGQPGEIVVYAVEVTVRRLLPDRDQLRNKRHFAQLEVSDTLVDSLIYGHGARVRGRIEPVQISVYGRFDRHGNRLE